MNNARLLQLEARLAAVPMAAYNSRSRVHRLRSFALPQLDVYIKRDDELSFGLSGSKLRKYLTLVPHMLTEAPDEVAIVGGAYSNNVLAMCQLALENGIRPVVLLVGKKPDKVTGNFLLTSLMVAAEDMHWLGDMSDMPQGIQAYLNRRAAENARVFLVPLGANCATALPGALTLALDIARNEAELGFQFDHIFIDAGTGMSASALLLAFAWLEKQVAVHVVHMMDNLATFPDTCALWQVEFEKFMDTPLLPSPAQFNSYRPHNAASFGAVSATVMETIATTARQEGLLLDPIYSAKLLLEGRRIITDSQLHGRCLFIHSGGGLALLGFVDQLEKLTLQKKYAENS